MRIRLAILLCTALAAGCTTLDPARERQEPGSRQTFSQSFELVFAAALTAARKHEIAIVEQDEASGRIVLSRGVSLWSLGERITVSVRRAPPAGTEVRIVSEPVFSPLNFPSDWESRLLYEIGETLKPAR